MKKREESQPPRLRLRKRTVAVLSGEQINEVVGAGSNVSCDGGDCHGNGTGNATDCWEDLQHLP